MKRFEKVYNKLKETMTDEEIADAMLIPQDLTNEEMKKANNELRAFRFKLLAERTEEQRIYSDLLQFRYQTKNYIQKKPYQTSMSFSKRLEEYARILKKTKKELASDLGIHCTKLSRIINNRETPNTALMYRLEAHSGDLVPSILRWKLWMKQKAFEISNDKKTKSLEADKVKNAVSYSA
ncbi:MAG: hypothetical protein AAGI23_14345 [Bacteroidota bacterium]